MKVFRKIMNFFKKIFKSKPEQKFVDQKSIEQRKSEMLLKHYHQYPPLLIN